MARVLETANDRMAKVLRTTCRDRWFVAVGGLYALDALLGALPAVAAMPRVGAFATILLIVVVANQLVAARRGLRESHELDFWRDLGLTLGLWSLVTLIEALAGEDGGLAAVGLDGGRWAIYLLLLAAAERHPHLHGPWRPSAAEHMVRWPAVAMLATGWTVYFAGVPRIVASSTPSAQTVLLGWLTLDTLIVLRYALLARRADVWRWRRLYEVLALAMLAIFVADGLRLSSLLGIGTVPPAAEWLSRNLHFVVLSFAIALSRLRLPPRLTGGPATSGLARLAGGQAGVLAAWALLVPVIHGTLFGFGLLDEAYHHAREILVVLGVLALGGAAVGEHHLRRRRLLAARADQRRIEDTLRTREQDLRLILERRRGRNQVRRSEEQFASAFRASPDGLAISTLDDGRLLDVNPSFERILRRSAESVIGRHVGDLGLWPGLDRRRRIVELVRRDGSVRDIDTTLELDGKALRLRVSFEAIQVGADSLLLTVLRDRTDEWLSDRPLAQRAGLLDRAAAWIRGIGADGRTTYRNRASARALARPGTAPQARRFTVELPTDSLPDGDPQRTVRLIFVDTSDGEIG